MRKKLILIIGLALGNLGLNAQEAAFDDMKTLTPEQEAAAANYIHQGEAQEKATELCADAQKGKFKDLCTEDKMAFSGGTRTLEAMMPAVSAAYSMIVTIGGGGLEAPKKDPKGNLLYKNSDGEVKAFKEGVTPEEGYTQETEEKTDYCAIAASAGEILGKGLMLAHNQKSQENYSNSKPEARQAASFRAIADSHKNMNKTSKIQGGIWTGVGGCYAAYSMSGGITTDWKVIAKMGGAFLIGGFYLKKASAHGKRAKLLNAMADEMPQAGECNPYTDTTCFCSKDSSRISDPANYNKFCVPENLVSRNQDGDASVCIDQNNKLDEDCSCDKTKTCIDKRIKIGAMDFGLDPMVMRDPLAALKPVTKGFGSSNLDSALKKNMALSQKALKNFKPTSLPKLNDREKKLAKEFNKLGIPKAAAIVMAKQNSKVKSPAKLPRSLSAGLGGYGGLRQAAAPAKRKKNLPKFESAGSVRSAKSNRGGNNFNRFRRKSQRKNNAIQIDDFATKAEREAEIVNEPEKGIFDIISYRYRVRAWRQFSDQMKKSSSEE